MNRTLRKEMAGKLTDELPSLLLYMVQIDGVTRVRITMTGGVNAPSAKFLRLFVGEIPAVPLVENTICESATRADREEVALQSRAVVVDIVKRRALWNLKVRERGECESRRAGAHGLVPTSDHGTLEQRDTSARLI